MVSTCKRLIRETTTRGSGEGAVEDGKPLDGNVGLAHVEERETKFKWEKS